MPAIRHAFLTSEFLAQLERLSLLSRRIFRGRVKGERRSSGAGSQRRVLRLPRLRRRATTCATSTGTSTAGWTACTSSCSSTKRISACTCSSTRRRRWTSARPPSSRARRGSPRRSASSASSSLERVGVGVLRERVAEGWPPTRGRNQVTALVDFLAAVRARRRPRASTRRWRTTPTRSRQSGLAVVISDLLDPAGYEAGVRALLERRFDVHLVHVLAPEEMKPELAR